MSRIIVFDFDKTLTYRDTTLPFFRHVARRGPGYVVKMPIFLAAYALAAAGVLSAGRLKALGVRLFLAPLAPAERRERVAAFAHRIRTNRLYETYDFAPAEDRVFVVTASIRDYIRPLFPPTVTVLGSEIRYADERAAGLAVHARDHAKVRLLRERGVDAIDVLYTDSLADLPLARIAREIHLVCGDDVVPCRDAEEFETKCKQRHARFSDR